MEKTGKKKKAFVLDTNVLLHDPEAILSFEENDVVIPMQVIEELDKIKRGNGELPYSAREVLRALDSLREEGNLVKGVSLPGGGSIRIILDGKKVYLPEKTPDNRIISVAVNLKKQNNNGEEIILVSKDTAVRIKAESLGVEAQDYKKDKTTLFQRYGKVLIEGKDHENEIFSSRYIVSEENIFRIYEKNSKQQIRRKHPVSAILPKNIEQECAIDALTNPMVEIVALTGNAGSGKTLLSLASGLHQTLKADPLFDQVMVSRPIIPMGGHDVGFLPGDLDEKLRPWMQPIFDNLEVIIKTPPNTKDKVDSSKYRNYQYLIDKGKLHIEPLAYIRGRSLPRRYFIIDEAQNLRPLDVKTIITRCGEGTKIVFTGDLGQIDTPYLDSESNGLAYLISRYINEPEFCYLHFTKSARSSMADKAARLL